MNIAQVAFSVDWFLTIPGILISCGVILLIIALIMFVVSTNSKTSEEVPSVLNEEKDNNVEPVVVEEEPKVVPLIDTVSEEVIIPSFVGDENDSTIESPVDDTVTLEEFIPDVDEIPVVEINEEPKIEDSVIEIPVSEEVNVEELPTIETVSEEVPVIEISDTVEEVEHRPIYGGADPLEATQKLPKMDVHYEPYSGGSEVQEVTVIDEEESKEPVFILNEEPAPIFDESQNVEVSVDSVEEVEIPVIIEPTAEVVPEVIAIPDEEIEEL